MKNLVHVCGEVANLAEGFPLAGNGNISHSDQDKALQHFSLSLKCEVSYFGSDAIADFMFSKKIEVEESEQSLFRRFAPYKSLINARNGNISHLKSI